LNRRDRRSQARRLERHQDSTEIEQKVKDFIEPTINLEQIPKIPKSSHFFWNGMTRQVIIDEFQYVIDYEFLKKNGILIPNQIIFGNKVIRMELEIECYLFNHLIFLWSLDDNCLNSICGLGGDFIYSPFNTTIHKTKKRKERQKRKMKKFKRK